MATRRLRAMATRRLRAMATRRLRPTETDKDFRVYLALREKFALSQNLLKSCYLVMSLLIEMRIPDTYRYVDVIQYHGVFGV